MKKFISLVFIVLLVSAFSYQGEYSQDYENAFKIETDRRLLELEGGANPTWDNNYGAYGIYIYMTGQTASTTSYVVKDTSAEFYLSGEYMLVGKLSMSNSGTGVTGYIKIWADGDSDVDILLWDYTGVSGSKEFTIGSGSPKVTIPAGFYTIKISGKVGDIVQTSTQAVTSVLQKVIE